MAIFDDLEAEQVRLAGILTGLDDAQWAAPSGAAGWSVADVVLHLAQSEESVLATIAGHGIGTSPAPGMTVDQIMDYRVRSERAAPAEAFRRWRTARVAALEALRSADPSEPLPWVGTPVKPATLATTRLAEHWAHALDIADPLALDYSDTDRLQHVAWLAHRSLPYAFVLAGDRPAEILCDLTAPDGTARWTFGPAGAESVISGPAGAFCRVAAQRLVPDQSGMHATGPQGEKALRLLRTYAA
jgi:uncharacterized protein (TIGR03084 family)